MASRDQGGLGTVGIVSVEGDALDGAPHGQGLGIMEG